MSPSPGRGFTTIALLALLAFVASAWWSERIVDTSEANLRVVDLTTEHLPVFHAGFSRLKAGDLPLWNPNQLAGTPFMAVPWTGLLYPGNLAYLAIDDVPLAIEVTELAHVVLGGFCMFFFILTLGMSRSAGVAASLSVMMSGWIAVQINFPVLVQGMMYLPATMLAVSRSLRGGSLAPFALALVVALQILNGSTEFLVYNLYAAGLYTLFELATDATEQGLAATAWRGATLVGAIGLGVGLAAAQVLPSLELAAESSRAEGGALSMALYRGTLPPEKFIRSVLSSKGLAGIGVLPLLGVWLGAGVRGQRALWLYACTLAIAAMLLAFGGTVYELYHQTPVGALFRRPTKFLHLWAFAGALLSALAVARLQGWRDDETTTADVCRRWSWIGALASAALGFLWVTLESEFDLFLLSTTLSLVLFAVLANPRIRTLLLVALVFIHGLDLFTSSRNRVIRPYAAPEQTDRDARLFDRLGAALQHDGRGGRIHLSPELHLDHGLMLKQGTLRNLPVTMDKQPLAPERSQRFIQRAAGRSRAREGNATLSVGSGWRLLDLMSARFYVLEKDQGLAVLMAKLAESVNGEVRRIVAGGRYVVFERSAERWIPRAHVAPLQRVVANGEEALDAVSSPDFDPQREIVIESPPDASLPDAASREDVADFEGSARIVIDEPERVVIETETNAPGLLLLTDAYFPGWQASVDGIDTPILHANYLSRAVPITAGRSRVEFEYAPASFGTGLLISGASGCLLIALASATAYRNRRGGSG